MTSTSETAPASSAQSGGRENPVRVTAVDGLRGLLAVVVLTWHLFQQYSAAWLLLCANLAVAVFFVLSGYVLTRGWDNRYCVFLVRRFVRLWPVYALCLGAGYLIAGVPPVLSEFFWYPLIGPNDQPAINPPIWSLFLEAWMMPFMPLVIWAGSSTITRAALCIAAASLAGMLVPQVAVAGLFVAGAYLARYDFRHRLLESAIPQWLGHVSYSLYLSHALVLALSFRAFGPVWGALIGVPAAFAIGWIVWRGVERPSIAASRRAGRATATAIAALGRRAAAIRSAAAVQN